MELKLNNLLTTIYGSYGLNCKSKGEDSRRKRSKCTFLGSQHFGVEGRVGVPGWD